VLSHTCEYALRAITCIARRDGDGPILARDIADEVDVPLKYLHKLLRDLVRAGLLSSTRGIHGGFRLDREPAEVRLADVLAPFNRTLGQTTCPFGNPECGVDEPCPVHHRWVRVVDAYRTFLESTTLADLLEEHSSASNA